MFDHLMNDMVFDSTLSNAFRIDDLVTAGYITYSSYFGKIAYQAGLRFEQTYFVGQMTDRDGRFEFIYPQGLRNFDKALFPSLYFSRKFNEKNEAQLNFSRKIGRPGFMQLIPFIMYADRQSVQIGNPVLAPEFINLAEINYSSIFGKSNILSSLYLRHTSNTITNFFYPSPDDPEVLIGTFINGLSSLNYGWENTYKLSINKSIDFTVNAHVFYTNIEAEQNNIRISNQGLSWNAKAIFALRLPKKWSVQINGNYEAPRFIPQGQLREIYFMDVSVNKDFNKHFTASFTVSDMFNTKRFGTFYQDQFFIQDISRRWEVRYARVNLVWKFGEPDFSFFRRRGSQRREPGSGGTEMQEM
jgi:outer membrane cobalamin receptor